MNETLSDAAHPKGPPIPRPAAPPPWLTQVFAPATCERCGASDTPTTLYWPDARQGGEPWLLAPRLCWDCCELRDRERERDAARASLQADLDALGAALGSWWAEVSAALTQGWASVARALEPGLIDLHNRLSPPSERLLRTPAGVMTQGEKRRRLRASRARAHAYVQACAAQPHLRAVARRAAERATREELQAAARIARARHEQSLARRIARLAQRVPRLLRFR